MGLECFPELLDLMMGCSWDIFSLVDLTAAELRSSRFAAEATGSLREVTHSEQGPYQPRGVLHRLQFATHHAAPQIS